MFLTYNIHKNCSNPNWANCPVFTDLVILYLIFHYILNIFQNIFSSYIWLAKRSRLTKISDFEQKLIHTIRSPLSDAILEPPTCSAWPQRFDQNSHRVSGLCHKFSKRGHLGNVMFMKFIVLVMSSARVVEVGLALVLWSHNVYRVFSQGYRCLKSKFETTWRFGRKFLVIAMSNMHTASSTYLSFGQWWSMVCTACSLRFTQNVSRMVRSDRCVICGSCNWQQCPRSKYRSAGQQLGKQH